MKVSCLNCWFVKKYEDYYWCKSFKAIVRMLDRKCDRYTWNKQTHLELLRKPQPKKK